MKLAPGALTHEEYLKRKKNETLSPENKAAQFGDARLADRQVRIDKENAYRQDLIDRLDAGLPMSKEAKKDARRFKREGPLE